MGRGAGRTGAPAMGQKGAVGHGADVAESADRVVNLTMRVQPRYDEAVCGREQDEMCGCFSYPPIHFEPVAFRSWRTLRTAGGQGWTEMIPSSSSGRSERKGVRTASDTSGSAGSRVGLRQGGRQPRFFQASGIEWERSLLVLASTTQRLPRINHYFGTHRLTW